MDFHLERRLRLLTTPEHKSLYSWAINEIDSEGKKLGNDQIPWDWTLYFTATSCVLNDSLEVRSQLSADEGTPSLPEVEQKQAIRVKLRPGDSRTEDDGATFSMFGTNRVIQSFGLTIYPITDIAKTERCQAWGSVSFTVDHDFRDHTVEDSIEFYLFVKQESFARYGAKIAHGLVNEIIFSVKSVEGFYSEWSPGISTDYVKVLTGGGEQKIELPAGFPAPPRLGHIGEAALHINRRLEFDASKPLRHL